MATTGGDHHKPLSVPRSISDCFPFLKCKSLKIRSMSTRQLAKFVSRRLSTNGKVLGEQEKAAENVYIKKTEREKLEKLAQKGPKPEETPAANSTDAKASESISPPKGVSTDIHRNYAVLAGVITGLSAFGWYYLSKDKKTEEIQD